jgi:DNA-directed RNA polymerase specialized sigma24 family protein
MDAHDESYELFRSAIVDRDEKAWAETAARYHPLLIGWAARSQATIPSGESSEDLAAWAIERAWAALSPERFAAFPNLAALLAYLRLCVTTAAIDAARNRAAHEHMGLRSEMKTAVMPEQIALDPFERQALWQLVSGLVKTEAERVVLIERYVFDLPPRNILARHPELFADIAAVYGASRNLCSRLRENSRLQRLRAEGSSV